MKPRSLLKELEQVAQAVHLKVRTEAFRNSALSVGGLCKVRGELVLILNSRTNEDERALALAEALRKLDTSNVEMSDEAREFIAGQRAKRQAAANAGLPLVGPGLRQARPKRQAG